MSPSPHASRHLEQATLVALLNGELDAEATDGIEQHLRVCRQCARQVEQWRGLFGDLGQVAPTGARSTPTAGQEAAAADPRILVPVGHTGETAARRSATGARWPFIAGLVLAAAAGLLLVVGSWHRPSPPVSVPLPPPRAAAEAGMAPAAATPERPASSATLSAPATRTLPSPPARPIRQRPAGATPNREPRDGFRPATLAEAARALGGPARQLRGVQLVSVELGPGDSVPGAVPDRPLVRLRYRDADQSPLILDQQRLPDGAPGRPATPGDTLVRTSADGITVFMWRDDGRWFSLAGRSVPARLRMVLPEP